MKRKTYIRITTGSKIFLITILLILVLVGAVGGVAYYIHHTNTQTETTYLQNVGLVNFVNIGEDQKMNVAIRGSSTPKHTFVTIAGMGYSDYGVYMNYITQSLQNENRLIIIDRLGTGYSDDTSEERTCAAIVEEYRKALQKSMIEAPYLLLAHEIGAAYATYWQTAYPNEVEGIIYIDPNPIDGNYKTILPRDNASLMAIGCKFGLQRLMYNQLYTPEAARIPNEYVTAASYLNGHNTYSFGYLSEVENATKNFTDAMNAAQTSTIPKMYINSSYAFETTEEALEYIDYMNVQTRSVGQEKAFSDPNSAAQTLIAQSQSMQGAINTYVEKLGSCHLVKMPGGPNVYEQHPGILEAAITDFIAYLDGNVPTLQDQYVDKKLENWQQNQEQEDEEQEEVTEPFVENETES